MTGGTIKGVSLDAVQDEATLTKLLQDDQGAVGRVDDNAGRVIENQESPDVARQGPRERSTRATPRSSSSPSRRRSRSGRAAAACAKSNTRTSSRCCRSGSAKNANALASSEEIDPEVAFLLGKDAGTFRDILNGLLKGSEALRLPGVKNDDARATLVELQKRFATYDAGVERDPAEHEPAGDGEAGGARR